ncbi:MAG: VOC family protein [Herbiconiux sp.]|nr:VOC family protein [Herbiconiux sp.]
MSEQKRTYPPGVTCWVDTEQPDPAAAADFYGGLFGWSFENAMPPDAPEVYLIATLGGRDVGAIGTASGSSARWSTYVAVDDADTAAAAVTSAGGGILQAPQDAGPGGRMAVCADPQGAEFRLWQARRRLGSQIVNEPGSWNFSDLRTTRPRDAEQFYRAVFGWQYLDLGEGVRSMIAVPGYGDHLAATADPGIHERQAGAPEGFADVIGAVQQAGADEPPHWHVTFSVDSRDESARRAVELGGTVTGTADTRWAALATVRDPQGATFSVSQFAGI